MPVLHIGRIGQPDSLTIGIEADENENPSSVAVQEYLFDMTKDSLIGVDARTLALKISKRVETDYPGRSFFVEIMGPGQGYRIDRILPPVFLVVNEPLPDEEDVPEEPEDVENNDVEDDGA